MIYEQQTQMVAPTALKVMRMSEKLSEHELAALYTPQSIFDVPSCVVVNYIREIWAMIDTAREAGGSKGRALALIVDIIRQLWDDI